MNTLLKSAAIASLVISSASYANGELQIGMTYQGQGGVVNNEMLIIPPSIENSQKEIFDSRSEITPEAAATGIEYYEVYAVGSSNLGWDYVTASATSTSPGHGGSQLRVAILQYGYGNVGSSTLAGTQGTNLASEYLCGTMSTLHYCSVGETITGFMRYISFDGMQGGYFSSIANSTASPYGSWSDSIYIQ